MAQEGTGGTGCFLLQLKIPVETLRTIILQRLQEVGLFWGGVTVRVGCSQDVSSHSSTHSRGLAPRIRRALSGHSLNTFLQIWKQHRLPRHHSSLRGPFLQGPPFPLPCSPCAQPWSQAGVGAAPAAAGEMQQGSSSQTHSSLAQILSFGQS